MTEQRLKVQLGIFIILANLIVVAATLILYFAGGFLYEEVTTTIALLVPMFSVYTTAITRHFIATRHRMNDKSRTVSPQYLFVSWLFPSVLTVFLVALVLLKAYNVAFSSFEEFKGMLILTESIFGAYVGVVLSTMFNVQKAKPEPARAS